MRPGKPAATVKRAKALRRTLTKPEAMLWRYLRASPHGLRFRKQHPAGPFILDFFCARANLAIEIDGIAHDMGDRPARDAHRDQWLAFQRIDTLRIAAIDVLRNAAEVADLIVLVSQERRLMFAKTPPSSPVDGEDLPML